MKRPTLLTMMLVPTLLTITIGLVGFGVYVDRVEVRNRLADFDEELVRAEAGGDFRPPPNVVDPEAPVDPDSTGLSAVNAPIELIVAPDGALLGSNGADNPFSAAELSELANQTGTSTTADGEYRVLVTGQPNDSRTVTALPLASFDTAVSNLRRTLLIGGAVVVLLEALVLWLVARAVSRPVVQMIGIATRVADGELDTEVGRPTGSRETADLALDIERMLDRLRSMLEASESSAADARAARDDMKRFLADVSHEFRTPLTALHGYSDLHAKGMLDDESIERAMQRIGSESERLNAMVNAMLQLARDDSADEPPTTVEVGAVVRNVVDDLLSAHQGRTIELDIEPDRAAEIVGIPGQIHQAVLNLGANACAHSDGDIGIRVKIEQDHVAIIVMDHGVGIEPADRDKIFEPFFRLDASRARSSAAGAGLGLALTRQIVDLHHGTIAVSQTVGGGATFTVHFPLASGALSQQ